MISIIETGALLNPDMTPMNAASATLVGLSRDSKPTNAGNGWIFSEIDTGKIYIFDAENSTWREWSSGGGGGGGGSDSSVVVVHKSVDDVLDKTWQEIYDALAAAKIVILHSVDSPPDPPYAGTFFVSNAMESSGTYYVNIGDDVFMTESADDYPYLD